MFDIHHRVGITSQSAAEVYTALTTTEGLSNWWTADTSGDPGQGGMIEFRFPEGGFDMVVLEATPGELVRWKVTDGPAEWIDTTIEFQLSRSDEMTIVNFAHTGWAEPVEFFGHCSMKWATFMLSLKALVETGAGAPAPRDVSIGNWG